MKNEYLDTLGLQPGATKAEVKTAYRRLSKIHHPDISKDPNAKEKFIEINEAYNFLTKVGPTPHQETVSYNYNPYVSEYDQWRKEARRRAWQKAKEQERMQQELIVKLLKGFNVVALLIFLTNMVLIVDYVLPKKEETQEILSIYRVYESGRHSKKTYRYDEIHFETVTMLFDRGEVTTLKDLGPTGRVVTTRLFHTPIAAYISIAGNEERHEQIYSIYRVFGFLIPAILLFLALYRYAVTSLDPKLTLALFLLAFFMIQLWILLLD